MKTRTNVKAGGLRFNHNEKQVRDSNHAAGLRVKTQIKAGGFTLQNHNEKLLRAVPRFPAA